MWPHPGGSPGSPRRDLTAVRADGPKPRARSQPPAVLACRRNLPLRFAGMGGVLCANEEGEPKPMYVAHERWASVLPPVASPPWAPGGHRLSIHVENHTVCAHASGLADQMVDSRGFFPGEARHGRLWKSQYVPCSIMQICTPSSALLSPSRRRDASRPAGARAEGASWPLLAHPDVRPGSVSPQYCYHRNYIMCIILTALTVVLSHARVSLLALLPRRQQLIRKLPPRFFFSYKTDLFM